MITFCKVFILLLFYIYNHREYIEKAIKPIAKVKYNDIKKKKRLMKLKNKKIDLLKQTVNRLSKISYYTTI